jgi:hypothetical protein
MGKGNFFLSTMPLSPAWLHVGAPQKIQGKMNLISILNKTSPQAHTKAELDMLGVPKKLVKNVVYSSKRKK